tara:strand:- start:87 stop:485 length:399 start_codon:yes stop_codon:yes gene_type:complete
MKKEAKVEYGITITKPWSTEMYDHNEEVQTEICDTVLEMWEAAMILAQEDFDSQLEDDQIDNRFVDSDWDNANEAMIKIQKAVTCYGFGNGYTIEEVNIDVKNTIANAALFHVKEIAEELELELEREIIGFS